MTTGHIWTTRYLIAIAMLATPGGATIGYRQGDTLAPRTVWDGTYTATQAERGLKQFAEVCASCHGADMRGAPGTSALAGPEFLFGWDGKTVGDLFDNVRTEMPPGQAGTLTDQQYADVLAAIFKQNDFPAGDVELLPERKALGTFLITRDKR